MPGEDELVPRIFFQNVPYLGPRDSPHPLRHGSHFRVGLATTKFFAERRHVQHDLFQAKGSPDAQDDLSVFVVYHHHVSQVTGISVVVGHIHQHDVFRWDGYVGADCFLRYPTDLSIETSPGIDFRRIDHGLAINSGCVSHITPRFFQKRAADFRGRRWRRRWSVVKQGRHKQIASSLSLFLLFLPLENPGSQFLLCCLIHVHSPQQAYVDTQSGIQALG
mmetsp:Transcript_16201/g.33556  ORF Transcript_16201/g.33556 Transcript_16201/m.33556 type:complete len:220 (+) Transcript_16201:829-1488(+)